MTLVGNMITNNRRLGYSIFRQIQVSSVILGDTHQSSKQCWQAVGFHSLCNHFQAPKSHESGAYRHTYWKHQIPWSLWVTLVVFLPILFIDTPLYTMDLQATNENMAPVTTKTKKEHLASACRGELASHGKLAARLTPDRLIEQNVRAATWLVTSDWARGRNHSSAGDWDYNPELQEPIWQAQAQTLANCWLL